MSDRITTSDGFEVICLTDGASVFGLDVFPGLSPERCASLLAAQGESEIRTEFNGFLIRGADGVTLVDSGCGEMSRPKAGHLVEALAACGVTPGQITLLVFTHLHGDHCGGALAGGQVVFPNAKVYLTKAEFDFWQGKDSPAGRMLSAYADHLHLVADGDSITPGLVVWSLPGHTPGHIGLRVGSDLVIFGDIVHSAALQFQDPDLATKFDTDPIQFTAIRKAALAEIVAKNLIFTGCHIRGPDKFARLTTDGKAYRAVRLPGL